MARDALTENELLLKKTARRRLVGAVTLVILMLIILPFVLKDRVVDSSQENVEITVVNRQASREPILELPEDEVVLDNEASPVTSESSSSPTPKPAEPSPVLPAAAEVSKPAKTEAVPVAIADPVVTKTVEPK